MVFYFTDLLLEVERALVALPDFKSGVPGEQPGRWVRFPCTSATLRFYLLLPVDQASGLLLFKIPIPPGSPLNNRLVP